MELRHTLDEEMQAIIDNEELVKKAIRSIRRIRKNAETREQRHARQRQEMLDELREAFRELDEIKAGNLQTRPLDELIEELRKEEEEEPAVSSKKPAN